MYSVHSNTFESASTCTEDINQSFRRTIIWHEHEARTAAQRQRNTCESTSENEEWHQYVIRDRETNSQTHEQTKQRARHLAAQHARSPTHADQSAQTPTHIRQPITWHQHVLRAVQHTRARDGLHCASQLRLAGHPSGECAMHHDRDQRLDSEYRERVRVRQNRRQKGTEQRTEEKT